jgi:hypothetical protein
MDKNLIKPPSLCLNLQAYLHESCYGTEQCIVNIEIICLAVGAGDVKMSWD